MNFCKDCKHYRAGSRYMELDRCRAPQNGYHPVDGSTKLTSPVISRESNDMCGPYARFFEENDVVVAKPWYKFWS